MAIAQYFQTLTGFPPRQFQQNAIAKRCCIRPTALGASYGRRCRRLAQIAHLLNRQDVFLRALTGSGKTQTAIENPEDPQFEGDIVF